MRSKTGLIAIGLATMLLGCGCTTLAKRGFREFKGAESQLIPITDLAAYELLQYSKVELGRIESDIGPVVPPTFIGALTAAFREKLPSLQGLRPDGPTLRLDGRITFFQAGGTVGALLGKEKMCIVRVRFVSATGTPKGECLVVARSEAVRTGQEDLAREIAKRLTKYLQSKIPD